MANPIELVKAHPFLTVGGVIGVIVVVLLVSGGGGAPSGTGSEVTGAAIDPMAAINAQLSAQSMQVGAAKEVALSEMAAKVTLAQLNSADSRFLAEKSAALEEKRLTSQETMGLKQLDLQQILGTATLQAQQQSEAARLAATNEQISIMTKSNQKLAEIAAKPKGLFSFLFG